MAFPPFICDVYDTIVSRGNNFVNRGITFCHVHFKNRLYCPPKRRNGCLGQSISALLGKYYLRQRFFHFLGIDKNLNICNNVPGSKKIATEALWQMYRIIWHYLGEPALIALILPPIELCVCAKNNQRYITICRYINIPKKGVVYRKQSLEIDSCCFPDQYISCIQKHLFYTNPGNTVPDKSITHSLPSPFISHEKSIGNTDK
jgi:hypothetical protein